MPSLSTSQIKEYLDTLSSQIDAKKEEIEFFTEQIITADAAKQPTDILIKEVDRDIFEQIDFVNNKLKEVQDAYQARIDGGSRTDLFWRVTGIQSAQYSSASGGKGSTISVLTSPQKITYTCTRLNFNGYAGLVGVTTRSPVPTSQGYPVTGISYPTKAGGSSTPYTYYLTESQFNQQYPKGSKARSDYFAKFPFGINILLHPTDYDGTGSLVVLNDDGTFDQEEEQSDISSAYYPADTKIGFRSDKLHAIKYFDEPRTNDLANTTVTSFTGYISAGSTVMTVLSEIGSGVLYDVQPGQLVVVGSGSTIDVFAQDYNEIISIATTIGNLNPSNTLIQATAETIVSAGGTITNITVSNPGFGYSTNPTVTISPPTASQATATATISSSGSIASLNITNPGSGYLSIPPVTIQSPAFGATGTAVVSSAGTIQSVSIANSGFGYLVSPTIVIAHPGLQAIGIATTSNTGTISAITLTTQGIGYTNTAPPQIIIESPTSGTTGIATANVNSAGILTSITLTNVGSGYTFNPIIQIGPPTIGFQATASAQITNGAVTSIIIENGGSGYQNIPTVSISSPGGAVSAAATAIIDGSGKVIGLTLTNPGSGYNSSNLPSVIIGPPPPTSSGVNATATAQISSGLVTSITITNPGEGYTPGSIPSITIQAPFNDKLKTLILEQPASTSIASTQAISFDVLISASTLSGIVTNLSVPTNLNPFSPQTIGIMNSSNLGIGTYIAYNNTGESPTTKSWRPELKADALGTKGTEFYVPAVTEPVVGSGLIWYKKGFRFRPVKFDQSNTYSIFTLSGSYGSSPPTNIRPAKEGDTITTIGDMEDYLLERLPENQDLNNKLNQKLQEARTAVSNLQNSTSALNLLIKMSNTLRETRDDSNTDIWGKRNLLGYLQGQLSGLQSQLDLIQKNISTLTS